MAIQPMMQAAPQMLGGGAAQPMMQAQVQPGMQTLPQQQPAGWNIPGGQPGQQPPQTGLYGAANTLYGGLHAAGQGIKKGLGQGLDYLGQYGGQARQDMLNAMQQSGASAGQFSKEGVESSTAQGVSALAGFADPGRNAMSLQAALTGALGADKQAEAYANFQESPGQKWLREQMERSVTRTAAARGGLGGGNVMRELQREAMGLAQQDFQNSFNRLAQTSGMGLQAAGQQGQLYGQQAGLMNALNIARGQAQTQANIASAGNRASLAGQLGQMSMQQGLAGMGLIGDAYSQLAKNNLGVAGDVAGMRWDAGNMIAGNLAQTAAAQADLQNQLGGSTADIIAQLTGQQGGLGLDLGNAQAGDIAMLMEQLNSLGINTGNILGGAGMTNIPGAQEMGGSLGQSLMGGISKGIGTGISAKISGP